VLDDDVESSIPRMGRPWSRITLRHLLTQHSGLRDAFMLQDWLRPARMAATERCHFEILGRTGTQLHAWRRIPIQQRRLHLLGSIVSGVSGQIACAFADANIFTVG